MSPDPTAHSVSLVRPYDHRNSPVTASWPVTVVASVVTTTPYGEATAPSEASVGNVHAWVSDVGTTVGASGLSAAGPSTDSVARTSLFR